MAKDRLLQPGTLSLATRLIFSAVYLTSAHLNIRCRMDLRLPYKLQLKLLIMTLFGPPVDALGSFTVRRSSPCAFYELQKHHRATELQNRPEILQTHPLISTITSASASTQGERSAQHFATLLATCSSVSTTATTTRLHLPEVGYYSVRPWVATPNGVAVITRWSR